MTVPGKTRWVGAGLLAAIFVVGALSGAAVDRILVSTPAEEARSRADRRDRDDDDDRRRRFVIHEVEMTADQRAAIDSILKDHSERLRKREDAERERWRGIFRAITDSTLVSIKGVLTEEQQVEYERLLDERRQRYRDRRDDDRDDHGDRRDGDGGSDGDGSSRRD